MTETKLNKCLCEIGWVYPEFCPFCNDDIDLGLDIEQIEEALEEGRKEAEHFNENQNCKGVDSSIRFK